MKQLCYGRAMTYKEFLKLLKDCKLTEKEVEAAAGLPRTTLWRLREKKTNYLVPPTVDKIKKAIKKLSK